MTAAAGIVRIHAQTIRPAIPHRTADTRCVAPTIQSVTAAAAGVAKGLPASTDYRISIVNAPGKSAYPISSFTWLLVYQNMPDATKAKKLRAFVRWALKDGQKMGPALDYAPLPETMVKQIEKRIGN